MFLIMVFRDEILYLSWGRLRYQVVVYHPSTWLAFLCICLATVMCRQVLK
jgi:hypothetical protein